MADLSTINLYAGRGLIRHLRNRLSALSYKSQKTSWHGEFETNSECKRSIAAWKCNWQSTYIARKILREHLSNFVWSWGLGGGGGITAETWQSPMVHVTVWTNDLCFIKRLSLNHSRLWCVSTIFRFSQTINEHDTTFNGAVSQYSVIFGLVLHEQKISTARASIANIRPWQLRQPREQLRCPNWVEHLSFSAVLPCGRHYFPHTKWLTKIANYRDTVALKLVYSESKFTHRSFAYHSAVKRQSDFL